MGKLIQPLKTIAILIALVSIYTFLFDFLEADEGLNLYLGICATILTVFMYGKQNKI